MSKISERTNLKEYSVKKEEEKKIIVKDNPKNEAKVINEINIPKPVPHNQNIIVKGVQQKCILCSNPCVSSQYAQLQLCNNSHVCNKLCEREGSCTSKGKSRCPIEIPAGLKAHEENHYCKEQYHSCTVKCPMPDCEIYCSRTPGHGGLHESGIHSNKNDIDCCNDYCFSKSHTHSLSCKGGQLCGEITAPLEIKHSISENSKDECTCEYFWRFYSWKKIN